MKLEKVLIKLYRLCILMINLQVLGGINLKRNLSLLLALMVCGSFLMACSTEEDEAEVNVLDIRGIHTAIKADFGDDYLPDTSLSLEELVELTELEKDSVEEFVAEVSQDDNIADRFIAINAKENTSYDAAQTLLRYKEKLEEEATKYPESLGKIKASKVVRKGDTVFFIMIGKANNFEDQESEEAIDFYERQIQRVEEVIDQCCG